MKTKKYELTTNFMSGAVNGQANFAFRQENKTACWLWAQPSFAQEKLNFDQSALDQILADFLKKPTMSRARLQNYLHEVRRRLGAESARWPQYAPAMLMMVSNYSKVVWTMSGELALYRIHKGHLRIVSHHSPFQRLLGIQPDLLALHAEKSALHDEDAYVIVNAKLAKHLSAAELNAIVAGERKLDRQTALAVISARRVAQAEEKENAVGLQGLRKREVVAPVLIVACSGVMAVYQVETQWAEHRASLQKSMMVAHRNAPHHQKSPQLELQPLPTPQPLDALAPRTEIIADLGPEATKKLNADPLFPEMDKEHEVAPCKKVESALKLSDPAVAEVKDLKERPANTLKSATASTRNEKVTQTDKIEKPVEQKSHATIKGGQLVQTSEGVAAQTPDEDSANSIDSSALANGAGMPYPGNTSDQVSEKPAGVGTAETNSETVVQLVGPHESKKSEGIDKLLKSFETERGPEELSTQPTEDSEPVE